MGATRPQAYHAGISTFMRRPMADLASLRPGVTAVFGIPYDYTSGSRPGARWGPRGIRQSSAYFDYFLRSSPDASYVDLKTGREVRCPEELGVVDLGDVEIFPDGSRAHERRDRVLHSKRHGHQRLSPDPRRGSLRHVPVRRGLPGGRRGDATGRVRRRRPPRQPPRHVRREPGVGPRLPRVDRPAESRSWRA
jgi:Arginase family